MIISEKHIDKMIDYRERNYSAERITISRPKLKFHKLVGEKRLAPIEIELPINKNLIIKEKFDWNLDDCVDVSLFVEHFQSSLNLFDVDKKSLEDQIYFQLIDHIERFTIRNRMTKEEKLKSDRIKELLKQQEEANLQSLMIKSSSYTQERYRNIEGVRRKIISARNMSDLDLNSQKKKCEFCNYLNLTSDYACRECRLPIKFIAGYQNFEKSKKYCITFFAKLQKTSDILKTFNLLNKIDTEDLDSILNLRTKLSKLIMELQDFDKDSKVEQCDMINSFVDRYFHLGLYYSNEYSFLQDLEEHGSMQKEKIKVMSERRGKPGRPKKTDMIKKFLKITSVNHHSMNSISGMFNEEDQELLNSLPPIGSYLNRGRKKKRGRPRFEDYRNYIEAHKNLIEQQKLKNQKFDTKLEENDEQQYQSVSNSSEQESLSKNSPKLDNTNIKRPNLRKRSPIIHSKTTQKKKNYNTTESISNYESNYDSDSEDGSEKLLNNENKYTAQESYEETVDEHSNFSMDRIEKTVLNSENTNNETQNNQNGPRTRTRGKKFVDNK